MPKSFNFNLITANRSYTVVQICYIFKHQKLHQQTVRQWVKKEELEVICKKPMLIYGATLKEFLKLRNSKNKKACAFDEFNCFHCKSISKPLEGKITLIINKNKSLKVNCTCNVCRKEIGKFYKAIDMEILQKTFIILNPEVLALHNSADSRLNAHIEETPPHHSNKRNSRRKFNTENQLTLL